MLCRHRRKYLGAVLQQVPQHAERIAPVRRMPRLRNALQQALNLRLIVRAATTAGAASWQKMKEGGAARGAGRAGRVGAVAAGAAQRGAQRTAAACCGWKGAARTCVLHRPNGTNPFNTVVSRPVAHPAERQTGREALFSFSCPPLIASALLRLFNNT
jgi:hypothetical protein